MKGIDEIQIEESKDKQAKKLEEWYKMYVGYMENIAKLNLLGLKDVYNTRWNMEK